MTVMVEVTTSGCTYGDDWRIGELREQVKREVTQMLRNTLKHDLIRIIGEPTVNVIRMEEKL
jgi:K+-transporting ATPase c subunit